MQNEIYINGLYARLDWIEFTIDVEKYTYSDVLMYLDKFGICSELFDDVGKGGFGYRKSLRHMYENIIVYFDGNDNMGIHIRISGGSVGYVVNQFLGTFTCDTPFGTAYDVGEYDTSNVVPLLFEKIFEVGHFTRIDLAVDDVGCKYYSVFDVFEMLNKGMVVSKFRQWKNVKGNTFTSDCLGHTVYFGSRESDVFLRVYEKGLEQKIPVAWVRWELEIKHEKADVVARQIVARQDFGSITIGILSAYLRFINLDNIRRSRCSVHSVWANFINDVEKLRLTLTKKEKTVEEKEDWIKKQCMPTIAGLIVAKGGDISFLREKLEMHFDRLSSKDKDLFLSAFERLGVGDDVS